MVSILPKDQSLCALIFFHRDIVYWLMNRQLLVNEWHAKDIILKVRGTFLLHFFLTQVCPQQRVFGVVDLFGFIESVVATSVSRQASSPVMDSTVVASNNNAVSQDSLELSQPESRQPLGLGSLSSGFHPATSAHIPPQDVRVPMDSKALAAEHNRQEAAGQSSRHSQPSDIRSSAHREQDPQTETRQGVTSNNKDYSLIQFHENTGKNVLLSPERLSARRSESYNQGIVMSTRPLPRNTLFQVSLFCLCGANSLVIIHVIHSLVPNYPWFEVNVLKIR